MSRFVQADDGSLIPLRRIHRLVRSREKDGGFDAAFADNPFTMAVSYDAVSVAQPIIPATQGEHAICVGCDLDDDGKPEFWTVRFAILGYRQPFDPYSKPAPVLFPLPEEPEFDYSRVNEVWGVIYPRSELVTDVAWDDCRRGTERSWLDAAKARLLGLHNERAKAVRAKTSLRGRPHTALLATAAVADQTGLTPPHPYLEVGVMLDWDLNETASILNLLANEGLLLREPGGDPDRYQVAYLAETAP